MKEETIRERFWKMMSDNQFVKSTDSITDEISEYPPAITDMEAVVKIDGEFDKYAIEEWLESEIALAVAKREEEICTLIQNIQHRKEIHDWGKSVVIEYVHPEDIIPAIKNKPI